jgi:hypothetical protein
MRAVRAASAGRGPAPLRVLRRGDAMTRSLPCPQLTYGLQAYLRHSCVGRENAASLRELAGVFHIHSRRISEAVAFLVAEGEPIGAVSGVGFWIVASEEERQAALVPERRRLASIQRRLRGLDPALARAVQGVLEGVL